MEERLPVMKQQKQKTRSRSSKKLLLFLFLFFVTLLLVLFFQSSLSKITEVSIEGQHLVAEEQIRAAAGVVPGDHFFSASSSRIAAQIKSLRMIEAVEVKKHFPGRIEIVVHEFPKVAYQFGEGGQVEALLADGSVIPVTVEGARLDKPILSGWSKDDPLKLQLCVAMSKLPESLFADVSEIKPEPSASYPDKIKIYTRSQFEIITTIGYLPEKMPNVESYIASIREKNNQTSGVLTMLLADSFAPFKVTDDKRQPAKDKTQDLKNSEKPGKSGTKTQP